MIHVKSNRNVDYLLFGFVHTAVTSFIVASSLLVQGAEIGFKIQIIHINQVRKNEDFPHEFDYSYSFLGEGDSVTKIIQNGNSVVFLLNLFRLIAERF